MDLVTVALIVAICTGLFYYLRKKSHYFKDHGIPYYSGWPILGAMAGPILRRKHFIEMIKDVYNVHPEAKYVGTFDFAQPVVVLRDLELIKTISIKQFDDFPDHRGFIDDSVDSLFGANLFNLRGDKWRETRNLLSPAFTSSKMKAMFELIVVCAENFANYIGEQPRDFLDMVGTKDLFTKYTNDVVATCAFGINIDTLNNPKNEFYVYGREATTFDTVQTLKFFMSRACPWLLKALGIKFVRDEISNFFKDIVGQTVKMRDEKGIRRPDMLQLMMDARGKENKHLKLDITEMTAQAFIFFFGGFDTSSTQMCIIAHELAINPDAQKKLQDEIDEVMEKSEGKPTYEMIAAMHYLDAVFNESMRRHPQGALLDRVCTKAFELPPTLPGCKPFTVQPGMTIWIPSVGVHMDPKYYDEPEKFNPDRYYQRKVTINDVHNLGFGIGPRGCIGNRFAIMETKVLFFFLLAKFSLKPNEKTCNPFVYNRKSMSMMPEGGFYVAIEPRS